MQGTVCSTGYPLAFPSLLLRRTRILQLQLSCNKPSIIGQTNLIQQEPGSYIAAITCEVMAPGSQQCCLLLQHEKQHLLIEICSSTSKDSIVKEHEGNYSIMVLFHLIPPTDRERNEDVAVPCIALQTPHCHPAAEMFL